MTTAYLWVKAFHIVFMASWFAGLFYLPRLFVNLAMVASDSHAERERLLVMARRLYRFSSRADDSCAGRLACGFGWALACGLWHGTGQRAGCMSSWRW